MIKYKDKIQKLLSLSTSSNIEEAKTALLKAQELMLKYNYSIKDFVKEEKNIIHENVDLYFTPYKNAYFTYFNLIAEQYNCFTYIRSFGNSSKRYVILLGLEKDVYVCKQVIIYIKNVVDQWFREYKKCNSTLSNQELNSDKSNYGIGFILGIEDILEAQKEYIIKEYGLVVIPPKEAVDYMKDLSEELLNANVINDVIIQQEGYNDGRKAELNKHIMNIGD